VASVDLRHESTVAGAEGGSALRYFGKKKLAEMEAAGQFVLVATKAVQERWADIANSLERLFQDEHFDPDDSQASFEFLLAVIATQLQALPNLLTSDQATRIREYVMQCLSSPDLESYPRETIQEYDRAMNQSLQQGEAPFYGVAALLFDKLDCRSTVESGGVKLKSPLVLMALSEKVVTFGGGWWKALIQEFTLVP